MSRDAWGSTRGIKIRGQRAREEKHLCARINLRDLNVYRWRKNFYYFYPVCFFSERRVGANQLTRFAERLLSKVLSSYLECLYHATSRTTRRRDGTEIERLGNVLKVIFLFNNVSGRMSLSAFSFRRNGSDDFFAYIECIKS
jgi:hypothetical protein